jgi:hypothetical protein
MGDYYNEEQRIPRRRSAATDDRAVRQTQAGSQPTVTRTRRNADDEAHSAYPMRPMVRNFARAPLTPPKREYVIPLTDGTEMRVTEHELSDLPKEYRQAAVLVTPPPAKRQALPEPRTDDLPEPRRRRRFRFHWLFWVGIALFIMIFGWIALSALGTWLTNATNQITYGYPRTYQTDYNVGHGTVANPMSHFIAENLNKRIIVIEIPGDDPSKSEIYIGPTLLGDGQDLTPVTLTFEGGTLGHPHLVIHVADSKFIFLNQQVKGVWKFVPAPNQ